MTGSVDVKIDDGLGTITICNEGRLNAIDLAIAAGLARATGDIAAEKDIRCVLLRGAGVIAFSAGVDLRAAEASGNRSGYFADVDAQFELIRRNVVSIEAPMVAMLAGACFGGGLLLSTMADFRIGAKGLKLAIPAMANRLLYPTAGLARMIEIVGLQRTQHMVFDGRQIPADTLLSWGLLDQLHDDSAIEMEALEFARHLASRDIKLSETYKAIFGDLSKGDERAAEARRAKAVAGLSFT